MQTQPRIISSTLFGDFNRYNLVEFQTRFGYIEWQVTDAERLDEYDMPAMIRQERTREAAMEGLA